LKTKVLMEEMSWVEIQEALREGKDGVIVVSGSIEQHGPHLPTATDTILGYEVAKRAAEELGDILVAPVIRPCLSAHHMGFPGSFTLSWETYAAVLRDYCESLAEGGFRNIVLTSSHGGNIAVLKALVPDLARDLWDRTHIHFVDFLSLAEESETAYLETLGISRVKGGVHAGYSETSQMLVTSPHLVEMDEAQKGLDDESFYAPENISRSQVDLFIRGLGSFSPNGILGDARGADPATGEKLLQIAAKALVEGISNALKNQDP